jgi:hypothetical protein
MVGRARRSHLAEGSAFAFSCYEVRGGDDPSARQSCFDASTRWTTHTLPAQGCRHRPGVGVDLGSDGKGEHTLIRAQRGHQPICGSDYRDLGCAVLGIE